jgi:hypothetical protein
MESPKYGTLYLLVNKLLTSALHGWEKPNNGINQKQCQTFYINCMYIYFMNIVDFYMLHVDRHLYTEIVPVQNVIYHTKIEALGTSPDTDKADLMSLRGSFFIPCFSEPSDIQKW